MKKVAFGKDNEFFPINNPAMRLFYPSYISITVEMGLGDEAKFRDIRTLSLEELNELKKLVESSAPEDGDYFVTDNQGRYIAEFHDVHWPQGLRYFTVTYKSPLLRTADNRQYVYADVSNGSGQNCELTSQALQYQVKGLAS